MRHGTRVLSFAGLLALLMIGIGLSSGAVVAEEGKAWTAEELQTKVVDHTLFASGGKGKNKWRTYYYLNPDGTAVAKAWGENWANRVTGTWKIKGNTICSKWSHPDWGKNCYEYYDKGKYIGSRGVSGNNKGKTYLQKDLGQGNVKNLK